MASTSSDVSIILGRRYTAVQLTAILRDWSALSLIKPVLVIDVDRIGQSDSRVPALALDPTGSRPVLLQEHLGRARVRLARVCVVNQLDETDQIVDASTAGSVLDVVRQAVPGASLVQAVVSTGSPQADWAGRVEPIIGWHNLALSPEDSASPQQGSALLGPDAADPRFLTHVVGALATLLGSWRGQENGLLDDRGAASGTAVVPVRTFSRALAADAVEDTLTDHLLGFGQRYPLPRIAAGTAVVVDDEKATATSMADALWSKHADVLPRARVTPAPEPRQEQGFLVVLKQFFLFMLNAVKNAPRALAEEMLHSARARVARGVENIAYGGDSRIAVVVKGVRSDGSQASWGQFESELEAAIQAGMPNTDLAAPAQKPALWRDFVDAGLTLLDAGHRSDDLTPIHQGTHQAVVSTTSVVAPHSGDSFVLPDQLAAYLPGWTIEPADDIATRRLYSGLDELTRTTPHLSQVVGAEKQRLRVWAGKHTNSYVGAVGGRLGGAFRDTIDEVQKLEDRIKQLLQEDVMPDTIATQQEKLSRRLRTFALGMFAACLLVVLLTVFSILTVLVGIIVVVVVLFAWLAGGAWMYLRGQRDLYAYLHRRRSAASSLQVAQRHRQEALEDLHRLARAYRQYLDWSRVFGAFVHTPLGHRAPREHATLPSGHGLPRSMRLGVAVPQVEVIDEVCDRWRRELFPSGWLSTYWAEYLHAAPSELGQTRFAVQADVNLLFQDPNLDGQGPILSRWSSIVAAKATERPAPEGFLKRIKELTMSDEKARAQLLSAVLVHDPDSGSPVRESQIDFVSGLDNDYAGQHLAFLDSMFSPSPATLDARIVRETVLRTQSDGLTVATVLAQFGAGLPVSDLRAVAPTAGVLTQPERPTDEEDPKVWV